MSFPRSLHRSLPRFLPILGIAVALASAAPAIAQGEPPHLAYVLPACGEQGTNFEVTIGGQYLAGTSAPHFSGGGIDAVVREVTKPLTPMQATQLRTRLQTLTTQPSMDPEQKERAEIRQKLAAFNRNVNPVLAETVTLKVSIAAGATPGERDLRLVTPAGMSNPLVFCVGTLPEFNEKEPQPGAPPATQPAKSIPITLPAVVNGRIKPIPAGPNATAETFAPPDVDRYRFHATRGQHLVAALAARQLIPYLADAVPGWFQATLTLFDDTGKQLAYDDDFRFSPDPVLQCQVPRDGDYVIEIKDAIYRGREDFVYRLTIGEVPYITSIFPLGGHAGARTSTDVQGWNLPSLTLNTATMDAELKLRGIYPLSITRNKVTSNAVPFAVDSLPEILEKEPNDTRATAQRVQLPVIVNGRIGKPGDWDVFSFDATAGMKIVAEVCARRLASPLDSVLKLTDSSDQQLAFNDDFEDKAQGLETHHADSLLTATLKTAGMYYLYIGDIQQKGGPEYAYRLRISPPQPDFDLRVVPSSLVIRGGTQAPLTVYAIRRDGFTGEINVALKGAPLGLTLTGGRIPANQDQVRCTLAATPAAGGGPYSLALEARATVQGLTITRPAVPADDMMQAFAYRHLAPAHEMEVLALDNVAGPQVRIVTAQPIVLPADGTVKLQIAAPTAAFPNRFQLELGDPPDGITLGGITWASNIGTLVLKSDARKIKSGLAGNLIIEITPKGAAAAANRRREPLGALPAIAFKITDATGPVEAAKPAGGG